MNQRELETLFSKKNLIDELREDLNSDWLPEVLYHIEEYRQTIYSYESKNNRIKQLPESLDIAVDLIVSILRCCGEITPIQAIASALSHKLNINNHLDAVKTAMELIVVCSDSGYWYLVPPNHKDNKFKSLAVEPVIKPTEFTEEIISKYMYLPPHLEVPKWKANDDGGMVTKPDHCILGPKNAHNSHQDLQALNMLQEVAFELDPYIVCMDEEPNKELDTEEKFKQFEQLRINSKVIYEMYKGRQFYFVWKFDKRGRQYSQGYHINLQSTDYKKALLNFAKKELITM